jgi:divalent metal cation (Fe/Co/Zn/Cd) transporter
MMSRSIKRNKNTLAFWAVWILVVCWFDMFWLVAPRDPSLELGGVALKSGGLDLNFVDLLLSLVTCVGVAGILAGFVLTQAKGKKLLATGDSRLSKSLSFQNI